MANVAIENIDTIRSLLNKYASLKKSTHSMFFKTGAGEYAQHDKFIGVSVPMVRKVAKEFSKISIEEINSLLLSEYNEERLLALLILTMHYKNANDQNKALIYQFYLDHVEYVNNWNLVDSSAYLILGPHLLNGNKDILVQYAQSDDLWKKRIAIITTLYFIRNEKFEWTFKIANILLRDSHDLIHKAVGWMLREVGKKNYLQLKEFLDTHYSQMPRTMLRYAIEKFSEEERLAYLKK